MDELNEKHQSDAPPDPLFDSFVVVQIDRDTGLGVPAQASNIAAPVITHVFCPEMISSSPNHDFTQEDAYHKLPHEVARLCFPDTIELPRGTAKSLDASSYTFVLTHKSGRRSYGFCRRFIPLDSGSRYPIVLCMISAYNLPLLFSQVLEILHVRWCLSSAAAFAFLHALAMAPPSLLASFSHNAAEEPIVIDSSISLHSWRSAKSMVPSSKLLSLTLSPSACAALNAHYHRRYSRLLAHVTAPALAPQLPQDYSFYPDTDADAPLAHSYVLPLVEAAGAGALTNAPLDVLFRALCPENLIRLCSAVLCEQRVLLVSRHIPLLTQAALATVDLVQPLQWRHLFVPLLPPSMAQFAAAPVPYIFGVRPATLDAITVQPLDQVVVVDLDKDQVSLLGTFTPAEQFSFPFPPYLGDKVLTQLRKLPKGATAAQVAECFTAFLIVLLSPGRWDRAWVRVPAPLQLPAAGGTATGTRAVNHPLRISLSDVDIISRLHVSAFVPPTDTKAAELTAFLGHMAETEMFTAFMRAQKKRLAAYYRELRGNPREHDSPGPSVISNPLSGQHAPHALFLTQSAHAHTAGAAAAGSHAGAMVCNPALSLADLHPHAATGLSLGPQQLTLPGTAPNAVAGNTSATAGSPRACLPALDTRAPWAGLAAEVSEGDSVPVLYSTGRGSHGGRGDSASAQSPNGSASAHSSAALAGFSTNTNDAARGKHVLMGGSGALSGSATSKAAQILESATRRAAFEAIFTLPERVLAECIADKAFPAVASYSGTVKRLHQLSSQGRPTVSPAHEELRRQLQAYLSQGAEAIDERRLPALVTSPEMGLYAAPTGAAQGNTIIYTEEAAESALALEVGADKRGAVDAHARAELVSPLRAAELLGGEALLSQVQALCAQSFDCRLADVILQAVAVKVREANKKAWRPLALALLLADALVQRGCERLVVAVAGTDLLEAVRALQLYGHKDQGAQLVVRVLATRLYTHLSSLFHLKLTRPCHAGVNAEWFTISTTAFPALCNTPSAHSASRSRSEEEDEDAAVHAALVPDAPWVRELGEAVCVARAWNVDQHKHYSLNDGGLTALFPDFFSCHRTVMAAHAPMPVSDELTPAELATVQYIFRAPAQPRVQLRAISDMVRDTDNALRPRAEVFAPPVPAPRPRSDTRAYADPVVGASRRSTVSSRPPAATTGTASKPQPAMPAITTSAVSTPAPRGPPAATPAPPPAMRSALPPPPARRGTISVAPLAPSSSTSASSTITSPPAPLPPTATGGRVMDVLDLFSSEPSPPVPVRPKRPPPAAPAASLDPFDMLLASSAVSGRPPSAGANAPAGAAGGRLSDDLTSFFCK